MFAYFQIAFETVFLAMLFAVPAALLIEKGGSFAELVARQRLDTEENGKTS